ncbi:MAG: CRTAC1 family protein [Bryobacteraceae bacterium]
MRAAILLGLACALAAGPVIWFEDVTGSAGITWRHFNGESPDRYLVESTTGGVAVLDFDRDGKLDLFLVNSGETPRGRSTSPVRHALYRNLGDGRFEDVAAKAGVDRFLSYGMGAAVGDYDNDGYPDLYITGYPSGVLLHNNGNGAFSDVTARFAVANAGEWSTSAAWFDYDRDGRLDLFICNYAEFSYQDKRRCEFGGKPTYCAQTQFKGRPPRLYRNTGAGFEDATVKAGLKGLAGRALGVVAIDADDDGWTDLFVARDASPNLLLINRRNGTFADRGLEAEVAYNLDGVARAGMGVDSGDINGDGRPDFVVTNFDTEYHALYLNATSFPYREVTAESRLALFSKPYVGWGVRFLDFDLDGDLDLLIVNGHLHEMIERSNTQVRYRERPLLLSNDGKGVFARVEAGPAFDREYLARGMAAGDFNDDGYPDAIFIDMNSSPVLLRNAAPVKNPWLGVQLHGTAGNRDAIGSKLTLRSGDRTLTRWITGGGSFLASSDTRVVFGLGPAARGLSLDIRWPNGARQTVDALEPNRYHIIKEK